MADRPSDDASNDSVENPLKAYAEDGRDAPLLGADTGPPEDGRAERNGVAVACAFGACVGAVVFGYALGFSSPSLPGMIGRIFADVKCSGGDTATSDTADLWSSVINVGCMVGALLGARVLDVCGRRGALVYVAGPLYVASWLLTARARDATALICARVALGAGVGVCSVAVPVYIAETAPASLRGALGAANQLAVTIGIFLVYLVGLLEPHGRLYYGCGAHAEGMERGAWRQLALLGALLGGALVVIACALPESPAWLRRRGKEAAAVKSLTLLRGGDEARATEELEATETTEDEGEAMGVAAVARALFDSKGGDAAVRAPLGVAMLVMVCQQFSGINAVIFFSGTILKSAGMANQDLGGAIVMGIQVVATGVACLLMDRAGRRPLLAGSLGGMAVAAGTMALYFALRPKCPPIIALGSLVVYIVAFSLGLGPIPWLLMAEILPSRARGVAASAATLLNWSCSFVVTETFGDLVDWLSPAGAFLVFACVCFGGCAYVLAAVPETKGLRLDEVEQLFLARRSD